ncbi:amidohydrolase family protein [Demetria terragena]|uniref:amidohydrolase family protein n=1 Tax=Demetria terragena TaxID=63959 RepID=UPI00036C29A9|nr:amidohydrolase family protein [Demetria terragena]
MSTVPVRDDAETLVELTGSPARPVLLRGGTVLTQDAALGSLAVGDVLIDEGRVAQVAPCLSVPVDAVVIDASDHIVMPGFVDSHVHAWEGQLRGTAPRLSFPEYMAYTRAGYAPHYAAHDVYTGTLATAIVALDGGITTIIDNAYNNHTPDHGDAAVEAMWDSGIRAVHASGVLGDGANAQHWPRDVLRLRDKYGTSDEGRLTFRLFATEPNADLWRFAKDHDLWVSTEMGSHVPALDALLKQLDDDGLLTHRHAFNHCYGMSDEVWRRVADAGVAVNMCARSDAAFGLGSGFPEVDAALGAGIRPGLSGDNELSYGLSMFTEMQVLLSGHRARSFERQAAAPSAMAPSHLSPEDVLEFATVGGALNAGVGHCLGTLAPGMVADVIMVRTTDVNTAPASHAASTITSFAHAGNVDTVFVGGDVRKFRGQLVGHDLPALRAEIVASRDRLMAAQDVQHDRLAERSVRSK